MKNFFLPTEENAHIPRSLSKKALFTYGVLLVIVKILSISYFIFIPSSPVIATEISAGDLLSKVNAERTARGMNTLAPNAKLVEAANNRARDMINRDYFSHDGCWSAFATVGYDYVYAGENLAMDFTTTQNVHNALMASSSHRANILNSNFVESGIAAYQGEFNGRMTTIVVELFGQQKAAPEAPKTQVSNPTPPPPAESKVAGEQTQQPPITTPLQAQKPQQKPSAPKIIFPEDKNYYSDINSITGTADALTKTIAYIDNNEIGYANANSNRFFEVKFDSKIDEGVHQIKLVSENSAGQSDFSSEHTIIIDRTPPEIITAGTFATIDLEKFTTYFETTVEDKNIDSIQVSINEKDLINLESVEADKFSGTYNNAVTEDSRLMVLANDKSGNTAKLQISQINLSKPATSDTITEAPIGITFLGGIKNYSDIIIIVIGGLVTLFLILKMAFRKTIQHHPTIINSILIIILAGALLVL